MKRKFITAALASALAFLFCFSAFAESGYAYGAEYLAAFAPKWSSIQADESVISLSPGAVAGEVRFGWLSAKADTSPSFRISDNLGMANAKSCAVTTSTEAELYNSNKVTVSSLETGKIYFYSYTENGTWSEPQAFTVKPSDEFTVLYVSDAQIGRSGDETLDEVLINDTCGWNYTVRTMLKKYPQAAFAISGGDQFQSPDSLTQMKAYLSPEALRSLPIANTIGNHDDGAELYGDIFNNPNEVDELLADPAGTGYYYTYGDVLFITMNSNNTFLFDAIKVLREAVAAHPNTKWRVVTMHHNPYSASLSDDDYSEKRAVFSSLCDCYDIDLVLSGHDHLYSRTNAMYGGKKAEGEGTVYLQASSASGSNYDPLPDELASFVASAFNVKVPTYTALEFSSDSLYVTTYRTDTEQIIDTFEVADNTNDSDAGLFAVLVSIFRTLFSMI